MIKWLRDRLRHSEGFALDIWLKVDVAPSYSAPSYSNRSLLAVDKIGIVVDTAGLSSEELDTRFLIPWSAVAKIRISE